MVTNYVEISTKNKLDRLERKFALFFVKIQVLAAETST